jgi:hypothetical protein
LMMRCVLMTIIYCVRKMTRIICAKTKLNNHTDKSNHEQQLNRNQHQLSYREKRQWHQSNRWWNHSSSEAWKKLLNCLINKKWQQSSIEDYYDNETTQS